MAQITIQGQTFEAPEPYQVGHELTENEAAAINQLFHENLRNNFAKKVKEGMEAGVGLDVLQKQFDEYAESYEFGVRTGGGGGPRDPVMSEAMNIARSKVRDAIKKKGGKISDYETSAINAAAKALIERQPEIVELAKKRVEEAQAAASADIGDLLANMPTKEAEAAPAQE